MRLPRNASKRWFTTTSTWPPPHCCTIWPRSSRPNGASSDTNARRKRSSGCPCSVSELVVRRQPARRPVHRSVQRADHRRARRQGPLANSRRGGRQGDAGPHRCWRCADSGRATSVISPCSRRSRCRSATTSCSGRNTGATSRCTPRGVMEASDRGRWPRPRSRSGTRCLGHHRSFVRTADRARDEHGGCRTRSTGKSTRSTTSCAGRFRVFKGIEANILADGTLDVQPDERDVFEFVVASPHSLLRRTEDQTARMLGAVRGAGVTILGHPRGRMFNSRPGVAADWDRVFAEAAQTARRDRARRQLAPAGHRLRAGATGAGRGLHFRARQRCPLPSASCGSATTPSRTRGWPVSRPRRVINCWSNEELDAWMEERRALRRQSAVDHVALAGLGGTGPVVARGEVGGRRRASMNTDASTSRREIDAGLDPESVQHVDQILGRKIPGRARGVRAPAKPARRGIERRRPRGGATSARWRARSRACRGSAARSARSPIRSATAVDDAWHLARMRDPNRVADRDFEAAHLDERGRDPGDAGRRRPSPSNGQPKAVDT